MALYRKGAGEGLLFIDGSLAHDANCCCSVCSDAVTIECCLAGESVATGQCECELLGGYPVTEANPCVCSSTTVSCCYEGNSISLSACDCAIIGGVANPASCIPLVTEGCNVCVSIEIKKRTIPVFYSCVVRGDNTGCGGARPACSKPPGYEFGMCYDYAGCEGVIGECFTCSNGLNCGLSGSNSYYEMTHSEYVTGGVCPTNQVIYTNNPLYVFGDRCGDTIVNIPIQQVNIYQSLKKCGTFQLKNSGGSSSETKGFPCDAVNVTTNQTYDNSTTYNCGTAC